MADTAVVTVVLPLFDETKLAVAGYLARYSGPTRVSYACDLRQWFTWCASNSLPPFAARRGHLELWARARKRTGGPPRPWPDGCPRWPASPASR